MRWRSPQLVTAYLWLQAALVASFWLWLWVIPAAQPAFLVEGWPTDTLLAFALPDAVIVVLGSAIAAHTLRSRPATARPVLWLLLGAVGYATLWCLAVTLATGAAWLALLPMLACTGGMCWCLWANRP